MKWDDGDGIQEKHPSEASELEREDKSIENRHEEIDKEKLTLKKEEEMKIIKF